MHPAAGRLLGGNVSTRTLAGVAQFSKVEPQRQVRQLTPRPGGVWGSRGETRGVEDWSEASVQNAAQSAGTGRGRYKMEEREEGVVAAEAWGWAATSSVEVLRGEGGEGTVRRDDGSACKTCYKTQIHRLKRLR